MSGAPALEAGMGRQSEEVRAERHTKILILCMAWVASSRDQSSVRGRVSDSERSGPKRANFSARAPVTTFPPPSSLWRPLPERCNALAFASQYGRSFFISPRVHCSWKIKFKKQDYLLDSCHFCMLSLSIVDSPS